MSLLNWQLARNPLNYAIVGTMAAIGIIAAAIITAPLRQKTAQ